MPARSTSRVYNQRALETWFENVALDWEPYFSEEALARGRDIYREGKITGVELSEQDAIVHCAFARKDTCYAVIEWDRSGPKVRASTDDHIQGRAVAVAGMYEIEELIADEIEPLAYVGKDEQTDSRAPTATKMPSQSPEVEEMPARRLTPRLEGMRSGLRMTAYWVNDDFTREPALHSEGVALTSKEREALVRLTGHAHDSGFHYRSEHKDFLLSNAEAIAPFFKRELKRLEECFDFVDLDYDAQQMAEGVRDVRIVGRVESAGRETMQVNWQLKLGRKWLDPEDAERLARAGRGTHIIKGLGLARITDEQSEALAEWRVSARAGAGGVQTWPRYMVFSLFGERGTELDLQLSLIHI